MHINLFGGSQKAAELGDVPAGITNPRISNLSSLLPGTIAHSHKILSFTETSSVRKDPVVLTDLWGHILYQWPDEYIPDWVDVYKACRNLGLV